ncbi:transcriptional regulator [Phenylobacterium sp.]|uniref:helix-turn-helix domain-containing protein n=1 Tax=Phenylobacterium sp. TaxID=1871053 RepID=UPI002DE960D8|nr:transcriptional regulator [Phenylobacterium sp.]
MAIRPIRNDEDHAAALREIERLWGAEPGTPESDALEVLATLVDRYEDERFPLPDADPVAVIEAYMENNDLSRKDLAAVLGSASRATEVMSHRRALSIEHIRRIHRAWNIPADLLIGAGRRASA